MFFGTIPIKLLFHGAQVNAACDQLLARAYAQLNRDESAALSPDKLVIELPALSLVVDSLISDEASEPPAAAAAQPEPQSARACTCACDAAAISGWHDVVVRVMAGRPEIKLLDQKINYTLIARYATLIATINGLMIRYLYN